MLSSMEVEAMKIFARNLTRWRKARGYTQAQLAELANLSFASIQSYEARRNWPGRDAIKSLASILNVPEAALFHEPSLIDDADLIEALARKLGVRVSVFRD